MTLSQGSIFSFLSSE